MKKIFLPIMTFIVSVSGFAAFADSDECLVTVELANTLDIHFMKMTGFGDNVEFSIMDEKGDTILETFRTTLDKQ